MKKGISVVVILLTVFLSNVVNAQWTQINTQFTLGGQVGGIYADAGGLRLGFNNQIYTTTNMGANWAWVYCDTPNTTRPMLRILPLGNYLFESNNNSVYVSSTNGGAWDRIYNKSCYGMISDSMYMIWTDALSGNVYRFSKDSAAWFPEGNIDVNASESYPMVENEGKIFVETLTQPAPTFQMQYSTDEGIHWSVDTSSLAHVEIYTMCAWQNILFAGTQYDGVYRSIDNGLHWIKKSTGVNDTILCFATNGNAIFVGTRNGIFYSKDTGNNWINITTGMPGGIIETIVTDSENVYVNDILGIAHSVWSRPLADFIPKKPTMHLQADTLFYTVSGNPKVYSDTMTVWNRGNGTLFPGNFQATDAHFITTAPDSVRPGDSGMIVVNYSYSNPLSETAYMTFSSNDPVTPVDTIVLVVKALVPKIQLEKDTLVFNATVVTKTYLDTLIVANSGTAVLTIRQITIMKSDTAYAVTFFPDSIPAGMSGNIIVSYTFNNVGYQDALMILSTNDPAHLRDTVLLIANLPNTKVREDIPHSFNIGAYPNPFSTATTISFTLPETELTSLKIYNTLGEEVATLVNGQEKAGTHSVAFQANDLQNGIYYYQLRAGEYTRTGKMTILR